METTEQNIIIGHIYILLMFSKPKMYLLKTERHLDLYMAYIFSK